MVVICLYWNADHIMLDKFYGNYNFKQIPCEHPNDGILMTQQWNRTLLEYALTKDNSTLVDYIDRLKEKHCDAIIQIHKKSMAQFQEAVTENLDFALGTFNVKKYNEIQDNLLNQMQQELETQLKGNGSDNLKTVFQRLSKFEF